ncbi:MAG: hypothetical protein DKINENOH_00258 [bacterium]|nr:hypothetical protein [bacterium]
MLKFLKSGGMFFLLAVLFMLIAVGVERPAVYICLGSVWMILGLARVAKNKRMTPFVP